MIDQLLLYIFFDRIVLQVSSLVNEIGAILISVIIMKLKFFLRIRSIETQRPLFLFKIAVASDWQHRWFLTITLLVIPRLACRNNHCFCWWGWCDYSPSFLDHIFLTSLRIIKLRDILLIQLFSFTLHLLTTWQIFRLFGTTRAWRASTNYYITLLSLLLVASIFNRR